ncbi:MAG: hypothetical protein QOD37_2627, partial [Gaiellales bacterium]|nr:hypothetical protein [Gaiellales bacterium]
ATASVNVISTNKGDAALCYLEAGSGGTFTRISSGAYFEMEAATDVAIPVVGSAVNQPAGTYTVRVQCKEAPGEVRYAAGDLAVVATG